MKRLYLIIILITFSCLGYAKEYKVHGSQGGLAMEVTLPNDFNEDTGKCPMVILMHGIFSSKNIVPIPALAKALAKEGKFNPADPPEYVKCFGMMKLGREYS